MTQKHHAGVSSALFCVLLTFIGVAKALTPINEMIDWSSVPASVPSARNLNSANLGQCICDLTVHGCDPNCCCDPDCTAAEQTQFDECVDQTISSPAAQSCYTPNSGTKLVRMNHNGGNLDRVMAAREAVCLVRNNYPTGTDSYFEVPSTASKPSTSLLASEWYSPDVSVSGFTVGERVPFVRFSNVTGTPKLHRVGTGFLAIPYGAKQGRCAASYEKPVDFMTPVTSSSCVVQGDTAAVCAMLDLARFTQQEAFANPSHSITTSSTLVVVTVVVRDATNGATLYTVDNLPLRSAFFTLSDAAAATPNTTNVPLVTSWDGTELACLNAVVRVRTFVQYDVSLNPRVRNVTREVYVAASVGVGTANGELATQRHEVYFLRNAPSGVLPPLPSSREGNPGFRTGSNIPAGILLQDGTKQAIQRRIGGFSIPSGGRQCTMNEFRSVPFMHNVYSSGCTVSVTEAELDSMCTTGDGTSVLLRNIFSTAASSTAAGGASEVNTSNSILTHVAKTGDADISDVSSWLAIDGIPLTHPVPNPFDPVARSCSNLVVGLTYKFVVARAGVESSPQDIIVGAFVDPIIGTWRVRNDDDLSPSASSVQRFHFRVLFERYDPNSQKTLNRRIKAPPILPEIDDTVFYPFRMP